MRISDWSSDVCSSDLAQLDRGQGVLLFGSHLGSFEVLRVIARQRPDYRIRVVLDKAHSPAMTRLLDSLNPEIAAGVIDAGQDGPSLMLAIKQAADEGALIALLVDRTQRSEEHTSELQSLMRISYAVFCLKKK